MEMIASDSIAETIARLRNWNLGDCPNDKEAGV